MKDIAQHFIQSFVVEMKNLRVEINKSNYQYLLTDSEK